MIIETSLALASLLFTADARCDISFYDPATDAYAPVAGPYDATVTKDTEGVFAARDAFGEGNTIEFTLTFSPMFNDYDLTPLSVTRTEHDADGSAVYYLAGGDGQPLSMHIDLSDPDSGIPAELRDVRLNGDWSYVVVDADDIYHAYIDFAGVDAVTGSQSPWLTLHIVWIPGDDDDAIDSIAVDPAVEGRVTYYDLLGIPHRDQPPGFSIRHCPGSPARPVIR